MFVPKSASFMICHIPYFWTKNYRKRRKKRKNWMRKSASSLKSARYLLNLKRMCCLNYWTWLFVKRNGRKKKRKEIKLLVQESSCCLMVYILRNVSFKFHYFRMFDIFYSTRSENSLSNCFSSSEILIFSYMYILTQWISIQCFW